MFLKKDESESLLQQLARSFVAGDPLPLLFKSEDFKQERLLLLLLHHEGGTAASASALSTSPISWKRISSLRVIRRLNGALVIPFCTSNQQCFFIGLWKKGSTVFDRNSWDIFFGHEFLCVNGNSKQDLRSADGSSLLVPWASPPRPKAAAAADVLWLSIISASFFTYQ